MKSRQMAGFAFLVIAAAVAISVSGCQKLKKPVIKPGAEGVSQEAYSANAFGYKTRFMVNTTPHELAQYFLTDLSWVSQMMGAFQLKLDDSTAVQDLSKVGSSIDVKGKILGIDMPVRAVNLHYDQDRELWILLASGDAWALVRVEAKPVSDRTLVSLNTLGCMPPGLVKLAENLKLEDMIASRIDYGAAVMQAKFDPSIDPKQLAGKEPRGESFGKFFQVYEGSVWINASPDQVLNRGFAPENIREVLDSSQVGGFAECLYAPENRRRWDPDLGPSRNPDTIYCPDTSIKLMGIKIDAQTFTILKPKDIENMMVTQIISPGTFSQVSMSGKEEAGGTRVWIRIMTEPPGTALPNISEAFFFLSGIPQWIKSVLLVIKSKAEAVG